MKTYKILVATDGMKWRLADERDGLTVPNSFTDADAADDAHTAILPTVQAVKVDGCPKSTVVVVGSFRWPSYLPK